MPTMQYPKILAFVEGSMERLFINSNFHYVHAVPVNNGVSWDLASLCKQIETSYRALNLNSDRIIVWVDREGRAEQSVVIRDAIEEVLVNAGVNPLALCVLVCDRMTENVILADEQLIREEFGIGDYTFNHKGVNGKSVLRNMYRVSGVSYKEMKHGVNLIKRTRLSRSAQACIEINHFLTKLSLPCWWTADPI